MWPCTRTRSSPASRASAMSPAISAGSASARATRVGPDVGALEEEPLAVDGGDPVAELDRAQAEGPAPLVAQVAGLGVHADVDVVHGLVAEGVGPPPLGIGHGDGPLHAVLAGGQRLGSTDLDRVGAPAPRRDRGDEIDRPGLHGVEHDPERHDGPLVVDVAAAQAGVADADRARLLEAHRSPDPTGIPVLVELVPVLEHAGEVALGGEVGRAGAGHLEREGVLAGGGQRLGDLEAVREEVALRVTQVGAVEPDVARVEDAVEHEPGAPVARVPVVGSGAERGGAGKGRAVQHRTVAVGQGRVRPPVARNGGERPRGVVERGVLVVAATCSVGRRRPPGSREVHVRGHRRCNLPERSGGNRSCVDLEAGLNSLVSAFLAAALMSG